MDMTNETILFVDDEQNVLDSLIRQLRKAFQVKTAVDGQDALALLERDGPVAVVVSDMRMPRMDGILLLATIKKRYPDTIRIMLTGDADLKMAIEAVNSGQIFRFLTKPCSTNSLSTTLTLALRQYQLVIGERELLDKTLKGSIRMLSEILSLTNPAAFAGGYRIREIVSELATELKLQPLWQFEIAALLSQVGCVTIPNKILLEVNRQTEISDADMKIFHRHPVVGGKLVGRIPRLEKVAEIITRQLTPWSETKRETDSEISKNLRTGGNLLHIAIDYDRHGTAVSSTGRI
jgi:response regulator RpfG family c-di-GMP phosphodiesterase